MNTSNPRALVKSREFLALDSVPRLVLRIVWKKGEEQTWSPQGSTTAEEFFVREVAASGYFAEHDARAIIGGAVTAMMGSGALVGQGESLVMPVLSGDRPRGETPSGAAERKRLQRLRDAETPERVQERREKALGRRQGDGATPVSRPTQADPSKRDIENVTADVTADVTPEGRDPGRDLGRDLGRDGHVSEGVGGEERERNSVSFSLSSSGNQDSDAPATPAPARDTARDRERDIERDSKDVTPSGREILAAFNEHSKGRVGTAGVDRPEVLARVESRFRALGVSRPLLELMAQLAGRGELDLLDKRQQVGLGWLAGQAKDHEQLTLCAWVDKTKAELARRERDARLEAQRALDLTPKTPAPPPTRARDPDHPGTVSAGDLRGGLAPSMQKRLAAR